MNLAWTKSANRDRQDIRNYIAQKNPNAALKIDKLFSEKTQNLRTNPRLGCMGRVQGTRELVVHKHYVIVYDLTAHDIRILRILHTARQWPSQ